jgi:DNA polymerase-3 subunit epsilon
MALYGLDYADLNIASRWECTVKIYKKVKANQIK